MAQDKVRIDDLKRKIKKAKQNNEPFQTVSDLQMELQDERSQGTLKGAFGIMRRKTSDAFYRCPEGNNKKKELLTVLKESIKEIEATSE